MYCGDWCSSPPDYCDPCDCYGNWTGGGHPMGNCGPAPHHGMPSEAYVDGYVTHDGPRIIAQNGNGPVRTARTKSVSNQSTVHLRPTPAVRCANGTCPPKRTY